MIEPKNILIVRTDRVGDVVLTLPLAGLIKKRYPECRITFLVKGYTRSLDLVDRAGLNIEYMYAFTEKRVDKGALVFRFADPDAALRVLQNEGINIISPVKLLNRA